MTAILESNWAFGLLVIALLTIIFSLGSMVKREEEAMRQMRDSDDHKADSPAPETHPETDTETRPETHPEIAPASTPQARPGTATHNHTGSDSESAKTTSPHASQSTPSAEDKKDISSSDGK